MRIWGALEACLERSAPFLAKSDRVMRVARLQLGPGGASVVGVRYPRPLLPEALAVIQTASAAGAGVAGVNSLSPLVRQQQDMLAARKQKADKVTPVDPKVGGLGLERGGEDWKRGGGVRRERLKTWGHQRLLGPP